LTRGYDSDGKIHQIGDCYTLSGFGCFAIDTEFLDRK
jgi:hypothetical protein